jgi:hypothetical protein
MIFSKIQDLFSPNGLTGEGFRVKLGNPTELNLKFSGEKLIGKFSGHYPSLTVEYEVVIMGQKIMTPRFSRNLSGFILTTSELTLELVNFPDFTINI